MHAVETTQTPNSYIICSTVRSGSTLLCKTLAQLTHCGQPKEYFHRHTIQQQQLEGNPEKFLQYCENIFQPSLAQQSAFGIKMHWRQLTDFIALAHQFPQFKALSAVEILHEIFPNITFVYLRRQNITDQAVSAAIASQTGQWESLSSANQIRSSAKPIKFQPWRIYEWENALIAQNRSWQNFFASNNVTHHEIVYENLVQSFSQEMTQLLHYLNADTTVLSHGLTLPTQQQSNKTNQRFIRYYRLLPAPLLAQLYRLYEKRRPAREEAQ